MTDFATYLYPHTTLLTRPANTISFSGHSWPYFNRVRRGLAEALAAYPELPLRQVAGAEFGRVHAAHYLNQLQQMSQDRPPDEQPRLGIGCDGLYYGLPGYEYSLGGMFAAIDAARQGTVERAYCFSLGGHHAFRNWGHGYCLLNPQAAAARYAQEVGFKKILIVDWDLHHGDGTQSIFTGDSTVYCISIHSVADLYMTVAGKIRAATAPAAEVAGHCNIPLLIDSFDDVFFERMNLDGPFYRAEDSLQVFADALDRIPWQPDYLFLFSGYDAHIDDEGRGVANWTNEDYQSLTRLALAVAQQAACPVLSVHGGGYTLPVTISAAASHVQVLAGED